MLVQLTMNSDWQLLTTKYKLSHFSLVPKWPLKVRIPIAGWYCGFKRICTLNPSGARFLHYSDLYQIDYLYI